MTIPGYVVPGQIICPIVEKENKVTRRFRPGRGVAMTDVGNGIKALTSTVVGKVDVTSIDDEQADSSTNNNNTKIVEQDEDERNQQAKKDSSNLFNFQVNVENKFKNSYAIDNTTPQDQKATRTGTSALPNVGDIVLARVTRLTLKQANVEIIVVENQGSISADSGLGIHGSNDATVTGGGATASGNTTTSTGEIGEGFGGIIRSQDVRATERDKVKILSSFKPGDIVRASVLSLGDGTNYYLSTAANELGVIFARSSTGEHMYPIDWQHMKCSTTGEVEERKCAKPF